MRILTMAAAAMLAVPADAQTAKPPVTELPAEARAAGTVVDAFHAALGRGDTRAAAALLADDALVYESGAAERGKAEYAAHHLAADAAFARAVKRSVTRRAGSADGQSAWIASEATVKGIYKTRAVNSISMETMVLREAPQAGGSCTSTGRRPTPSEGSGDAVRIGCMHVPETGR